MNRSIHLFHFTKCFNQTRFLHYGRNVRRFYENVSVLALEPGQSILSTIKSDRASLSNPHQPTPPNPFDSSVSARSTSTAGKLPPPLPTRAPRTVLIAHNPLLPAVLPPDAPQFAVLLDGRPLATPVGRPFRVTHANVAEAVAHEWRTQPARRAGTMKFANMHVTHLCNTVLDRHELEGDTSADVLRDLVGALESDTLLFRADSPPELAPFLAASWDPLLAWFSTRTGVRLAGTSALGIRTLSESERAQVHSALERLCGPLARVPALWRLQGLRLVCRSLKSLVLALAVLDARLPVADLPRAVQLTLLEQEFQLQKWGRFEDVHDKDGKEMLARLRAGCTLALPGSALFSASALDSSSSLSARSQTRP